MHLNQINTLLRPTVNIEGRKNSNEKLKEVKTVVFLWKFIDVLLQYIGRDNKGKKVIFSGLSRVYSSVDGFLVPSPMPKCFEIILHFFAGLDRG